MRWILLEGIHFIVEKQNGRENIVYETAEARDSNAEGKGVWKDLRERKSRSPTS